MSCGSDSFCPWNTTTSRSLHARSIASTSSCETVAERSIPSTSAPSAAFRFLIEIVMSDPSCALLQFDIELLDQAPIFLDITTEKLLSRADRTADRLERLLMEI